MLELNVKEEVFNSDIQKFGYQTVALLHFEHSLVTLSKWEAIHEIPFLGEQQRTDAQTLDYIRLMCTEELTDEILAHFTQENFEELNEYISSKQTATWFTEVENRQHKNQVITAEIIYYWMVALRIPFETQHWHLNRLLTLIRVTNEKQTPPKQMSKAENMQRHASLNASRRAARRR